MPAMNSRRRRRAGRRSMETQYIELHPALVLIAHECEDFLAEEISRDRQPMIAALKTALALMEQSGQVTVCRKED